MAKLLIIGGTGFFGKSILSYFIYGGFKKHKIDKIVILARNIDSFLNDYPELYCQNVEFVKGDIANISTLPDADYIIHAAASTNLEDYRLGNSDDIEKAILNFCRIVQSSNSKSKILYCSSGAVYGKNLIQFKITEDDLFHDDLSQLSEEQRFYCLSKRFAENEVINLGKLGLKVSIARCFTFSGKYLPRNQHYALGNFLNAAESGNTIEVKAKHPVYRSYMHSDDLANSLINIVEESNYDCPTYNVGSQSIVEIRDLARKIACQYSVDVKISSKFLEKNIDFYVPNTEKLNNLNNVKNISLIKKIINQNPTIILGSGIHSAYTEDRNVLNDWPLLLSKVAQEFKLTLSEIRYRKLTYIFEDLIYLISKKEDISSYKAENLLKKEICRQIKIQQKNANSIKLKEKLSLLTKSQFISLNVDTSIVDNIGEISKISNYSNSVFNSKFTLNNIPLFFLNGNVTGHKYLHFGFRSISNQINILRKAVDKFKKEEKLYNYNQEIIKSNDESWVSTFFNKPILIVGASIGEHELGLRYLLNQRKRNFSTHIKVETSVYIILDQKSIDIAGYREDLKTLGIQPIVFEKFNFFWDNI